MMKVVSDKLINQVLVPYIKYVARSILDEIMDGNYISVPTVILQPNGRNQYIKPDLLIINPETVKRIYYQAEIERKDWREDMEKFIKSLITTKK